MNSWPSEADPCRLVSENATDRESREVGAIGSKRTSGSCDQMQHICGPCPKRFGLPVAVVLRKKPCAPTL